MEAAHAVGALRWRCGTLVRVDPDGDHGVLHAWVQWVAPPAGRPDVGTWLPFLFRATPVAEPDGRSLRSKANNCRGRAFRRHAHQVPRRYEPPWVRWRLQTLETRMESCRRRSPLGGRRRVGTAMVRRPT